MGQFTESYSEIKGKSSFNLRLSARDLVLSVLSLKDKISGIKQYLDTPRIQFLYIHHSFRDELKNLDMLMRILARNHSFIPYGEAVDRILANTIDKPYISISSDDGFKNNLLAADVLDNYGAKACFFINPGLIEESNFNAIRQHCMEKLHFPPVEFLSWKDIGRLQARGHEIGGHTMLHDNMAKMEKAKMEADLQDTFSIISGHCGTAKHFAFPYGRFIHFNEIGRKAVFKAGFISCASAERGCHINGDAVILCDELCIRRDHVILDWNIDHTLYFMANNVKKRSAGSNLFPYQRSE